MGMDPHGCSEEALGYCMNQGIMAYQVENPLRATMLLCTLRAAYTGVSKLEKNNIAAHLNIIMIK